MFERRVQLAKGGFMAVVRFILRDQHHGRRREIRKTVDARLDVVVGQGEFGMIDL